VAPIVRVGTREAGGHSYLVPKPMVTPMAGDASRLCPHTVHAACRSIRRLGAFAMRFPRCP
jgi:hypothetical protein